MDSVEPSAGSQRVLVGVDGSSRDEHAVQLAASEAGLRGWPLDIVHVEDRLPPAPDVSTWTPLMATKELLVGAKAWALVTDGDISVSVSVSAGRPRDVLENLSRSVGLVVVGTGRKVGIAHFVFGTVSLDVAAHAQCPVLVVGEPIPTPPRGRVVVGVDGSEESVSAVRVAAEEALLRGAELLVHTSWYRESGDAVVAEPQSLQRRHVEESHRAVQEQVLAAALDRTRERPRLTQEIAYGEATTTLVEASRKADLVVVGNRGRGAFLGKLLGSVTMVLLQRSSCPVLVTRVP